MIEQVDQSFVELLGQLDHSYLVTNHNFIFVGNITSSIYHCIVGIKRSDKLVIPNTFHIQVPSALEFQRFDQKTLILKIFDLTYEIISNNKRMYIHGLYSRFTPKTCAVMKHRSAMAIKQSAWWS